MPAAIEREPSIENNNFLVAFKGLIIGPEGTICLPKNLEERKASILNKTFSRIDYENFMELAGLCGLRQQRNGPGLPWIDTQIVNIVNSKEEEKRQNHISSLLERYPSLSFISVFTLQSEFKEVAQRNLIIEIATRVEGHNVAEELYLLRMALPKGVTAKDVYNYFSQDNRVIVEKKDFKIGVRNKTWGPQYTHLLDFHEYLKGKQIGNSEQVEEGIQTIHWKIETTQRLKELKCRMVDGHLCTEVTTLKGGKKWQPIIEVIDDEKTLNEILELEEQLKTAHVGEIIKYSPSGGISAATSKNEPNKKKIVTYWVPAQNGNLYSFMEEKAAIDFQKQVLSQISLTLPLTPNNPYQTWQKPLTPKHAFSLQSVEPPLFNKNSRRPLVPDRQPAPVEISPLLMVPLIPLIPRRQESSRVVAGYSDEPKSLEELVETPQVKKRNKPFLADAPNDETGPISRGQQQRIREGIGESGIIYSGVKKISPQRIETLLTVFAGLMLSEIPEKNPESGGGIGIFKPESAQLSHPQGNTVGDREVTPAPKTVTTPTEIIGRIKSEVSANPIVRATSLDGVNQRSQSSKETPTVNEVAVSLNERTNEVQRENRPASEKYSVSRHQKSIPRPQKGVEEMEKQQQGQVREMEVKQPYHRQRKPESPEQSRKTEDRGVEKVQSPPLEQKKGESPLPMQKIPKIISPQVFFNVVQPQIGATVEIDWNLLRQMPPEWWQSIEGLYWRELQPSTRRMMATLVDPNVIRVLGLIFMVLVNILSSGVILT